MKIARLSRTIGLLIAAALMVALLTGAIWPRRAAAPGGIGLCSTQSQLTWCLGFEKDSTADTCDAETGYQADNETPTTDSGTNNCENPTEGTTSDVGQIEGDEDLYFVAGATNHVAIWDTQFTAADDYYFRFCFYGEYGAADFLATFMQPRSYADGGAWQGSGSGPGRVQWSPAQDWLRVQCPTEGGVVSSGILDVTADTWHQITVRFDASTPGAPVCSLWVDSDSSGAADASASGAGMVTDPFDIDGIHLIWNKDNTGMHFEMLQVDDTETDLVDIFGNDCRE